MQHGCNSYQTVSDMAMEKCVHFHHPIIHFQTVNMCCVVVPIAQVLISQANNQIGTIQTLVLSFFFIFIT